MAEKLCIKYGSSGGGSETKVLNSGSPASVTNLPLDPKKCYAVIAMNSGSYPNFSIVGNDGGVVDVKTEYTANKSTVHVRAKYFTNAISLSVSNNDFLFILESDSLS